MNLRGQIEELDVTAATGAIFDRSYTYDFDDDAPGPVDPGPNLDRVIDALDASESRFFAYDELDRLQEATDLGGSVLFAYGYDDVGNRTSLTSPAGSTDYAYEADTNRLDGATGAGALDYAHDAFGNRIYQGAAAYAGTPSLIYDQSNRLVEVRDPANGFATLASYRYDAFGRRVQKTTPTKTFLYLYDPDGHLLQEIDKRPPGTKDRTRDYVYVEDELVGLVDSVVKVGTVSVWPPLRLEGVDPRGVGWALLLVLAGGGVLLLAARRSPSAATALTSASLVVFTCAGTQRPPPLISWVHTDPLGTPLVVTNHAATPAGATAVWRASYEPFGKATVDEDPDGDLAPFSLKVRFPGQYEDAETAWHYNFYRTYDPSTGRHLEADPIGLRGGLNLFLYARANALRYIDRHGAAVEDRSSPGNPFYFGFPSPDEHFNRNQNNYCPKRPPTGCEGWRHVAGKWRSVRGYECAYDSSGRLLPDTTETSFPRYQNYSFNYAGQRRFTPAHLWQDWIPHWWYWYWHPSQHYPESLTPIGDTCEPCGDR